MKRSDINALIQDASNCFREHGWALPPEPRWDVTDFGLGDHRRHGLVLINLAEEPEYCEKLMYARAGMFTPAHRHLRKKEDIICRWGVLRVTVWADPTASESEVWVKIDGSMRRVASGTSFDLAAGSRVTLMPGVVHEFAPTSPECIIGEVSTANDDIGDNVFLDPAVGRFPGVEEDEPATVRLVGDQG